LAAVVCNDLRMTIEMDHLFVFSTVKAPEADELIAAGFTEGSANIHAGQGTACRRFFFANCMLEFLYVTDIAITRSGIAEPTGLAERWLKQAAGAAPFGLCFRPLQGDDEPAPFPSWTYGPKYLPDGTPAYEISKRCRLIAEPFAFFTPKSLRQDRYPADLAQPLVHRNGAKAVSHVHLESPLATLPDLQSPLMPANLVLHHTKRHRMQVEFDNARQGRTLDLSTLPLTLAW
jgi:hypothetical protein